MRGRTQYSKDRELLLPSVDSFKEFAA